MWWFDVNRFNINDPTTFGHIKDGKDDMALTIDDLMRMNKMYAIRNRSITTLNAQRTQLKADLDKLNVQLERELSMLRMLETEEKAAAEKRATEAKIRQQLETARTYWPRFLTYEAEILKVLEQDTLATDRWNALSIGTGRMAYAHTLLTAYQTVVKRHKTIQPPLVIPYKPYMPYYISRWGHLQIQPLYWHNLKNVGLTPVTTLQKANPVPVPVPVVDVTKVGTRVRYTFDGNVGVVIPRPHGKLQTSILGYGDFVYVMFDKTFKVFGCYRKNLVAL